jgi:primosomal protein N' (replication factor Y)
VLRADARREGEGEAFLARVREQACLPGDGAQLIGPLPSAMPRRAGRYRSQLLCLSRDRAQGNALASALLASAEALRPPAGVNWFIDMDPLDTL